MRNIHAHVLPELENVAIRKIKETQLHQCNNAKKIKTIKQKCNSAKTLRRYQLFRLENVKLRHGVNQPP